MNILIVKIGAIGDVVMALPLLTTLRRLHPNAKITWICGATVAPLLNATGLIDHLIALNEADLFHRFLKVKSLYILAKKLFFKRFDLVLTAHPDPRYRLLSLFCRKKVHRFFNRRTARPMPIPSRYHLDEYVRLATQTDEAVSPPLPPLRLPSVSLPPRPRIAIAPGGAKNILAEDALRRWPAEHYAQLLRLLSAHPVSLLVTGSPSDKWIEPHFASIDHHNLIGKLSLLELIAVYRECDLIITHDSGPLHLAKFAACPKIALFGPTNPYEKLNAHENIDLLWKGPSLGCCPCYDGKRYARCNNNVCLKQITPEEVAERALFHLGQGVTNGSIKRFSRNRPESLRD